MTTDLRTISPLRAAHGTAGAGFARVAVWLVPLYALLLSLSTLTHQPSYTTDFPGYARYITTDIFLASHLGASIVGAALGSIGVVGALLLLIRGPAVRTAIAGAALYIVANVLVSSVFGAAAYAQPAIGRAYLGGVNAAVDINADVYGIPLFAMAGTGMLLLMAGGVTLGIAVARTDRSLRWAGITFATSLFLFNAAQFLFSEAQAYLGAVLVLASVAIAIRLPRAVR
jgi:hypothetical protein